MLQYCYLKKPEGSFLHQNVISTETDIKADFNQDHDYDDYCHSLFLSCVPITNKHFSVNYIIFLRLQKNISKEIYNF